MNRAHLASVGVLVALIRLWQWTFSALLPPSCRFTPSCSAYGIEALRRHGSWCGLGLLGRRLLRCHPWGGSGFDPVPPRRGKSGCHEL